MAFLVAALDQFSKFLALTFLSAYESVPVIEGFFHLTLVHNTGVAFGLFQAHHRVLFILISLGLLVLFFWSRTLGQAPRLARVSIALILGGAVGNWIDRFRLGAVVDFLDFRVWPVFNLADSAITAGVLLYFLLLFRKPAPEIQPGPKDPTRP